MPRLSFAILISATLLALPSQADSGAPDLLAVGGTGIFCYQAPCPWRGIAEPGRTERNRLLWWGDTLPEVISSTEHQQRIALAWDEFDCVLVEGQFDGIALTVNEVLGACS